MSADRPVGLVISNCQTQPLAHYMALHCRNAEFRQFGIHDVFGDSLNKKIESVVSSKSEIDFVISVQLNSQDFGDLIIGRIRDTFLGKPVYIIPQFYFDGLHPDSTYIGERGVRVGNLIGDYHSAIAFACYLLEKNAAEAVKAYNERTYRRLGHFDKYDASMAEFIKRSENQDIPFAEEMRALLLRELCFYTINHPSATLLGNFSAKIADRLARDGICDRLSWPLHSDLLPDFLSFRSIYPIYPEIAAYFGVSSLGSYLFKPGTTDNKPVAPLDLQTFVDEEYRRFSECGRDKLLHTSRGKWIVNHYADKMS